jgi:hypothetical protein
MSRPAYVFLTIGAMWLIVAIVLYRTSFIFSVFWSPGKHDPALALSSLRVLRPVLFLGWIAPVLLGSWLLWRK